MWAYIHPFSFRPIVASFNEGLRLILGSPKYTPANTLYKLTNVDHPIDIISRLANRFNRRAWRHHNPSIAASRSSSSLSPPGFLEHHPPSLRTHVVIVANSSPSILCAVQEWCRAAHIVCG
ncbi:hypothetical protein PR048_010720 [Dryococelus australis]|uniref:Uncharacterized protein n=1 Tax=Dryococelus australis TaxID=614101 RepID=A0ABQ9I4K4_9NEOP|nr:hypothetical protein PR048_010720 [Dryococelus australis]